MYTPPKYPAAIPTQTPITGDLPDKVDDLDWLYADWFNAIKKELCAALTELGTNPKGSYADVAAAIAAAVKIAAPADGDIIVRTGGVWASLPKGADGKVLTLVSGIPSWQTAGGGSIPAGLISIWHGLIANIPSGWVICDGNNGTPNLLDKFVKGVPTAATNPGTTGGESTVTLDATKIPSHQHSISQQAAHDHDISASGTHQHTISASGTHTHPIPLAVDVEESSTPATAANGIAPGTSGAGGDHSHGGAVAAGGDHSHGGKVSSGNAHDHGANTGLIGGGGAHENKPPYYEVAFIMKT